MLADGAPFDAQLNADGGIAQSLCKEREHVDLAISEAELLHSVDRERISLEYGGLLGAERFQLRLRRLGRNLDAGASQPEMERATADTPGLPTYNFTAKPFGAENSGLSAFALEEGVVHHTYSCYARGLDAFNGAYQLLDRAPKGRDDDALPMPFVWWVRGHDDYGDTDTAIR